MKFLNLKPFIKKSSYQSMFCFGCNTLTIVAQNNKTHDPLYCGNCGILFVLNNNTIKEISSIQTLQQTPQQTPQLRQSQLTKFKTFEPFTSNSFDFPSKK
jgi:hypothetical protein